MRVAFFRVFPCRPAKKRDRQVLLTEGMLSSVACSMNEEPKEAVLADVWARFSQTLQVVWTLHRSAGALTGG
jgi:hypothetical protein